MSLSKTWYNPVILRGQCFLPFSLLFISKRRQKQTPSWCVWRITVRVSEMSDPLEPGILLPPSLLEKLGLAL